MGVSNFSNNSGDDDSNMSNNAFSYTNGSTAQSSQNNAVLDMLINLNKSKHNPCLFREKVINQLMSVVIGKYKPNAILTGPAGTGKTAIAEELAHMIEDKNPLVPQSLLGKTIYSLPLTNIVSGTMFRGQLEENVRQLVEFASDPKNGVILFIDEIHQLFFRYKTYGLCINSWYRICYT